MADKPEGPFADLDDLDDLDNLDDEEFLAAMDQEDRDAAGILMEILGDDLPPEAPQLQLVFATRALRAGMSSDAWPYDWFGNALGWRDSVPGDLNEDSVWLAAAGSVVSPPEDPGWDIESQAAIATLAHADWVAAMVAMVRLGAGADLSPAALVRAGSAVPEIEGDIEPDDAGLLEHAFEVIMPLWQALGAVDEDRRLTDLGCWGLPRALWMSWAVSGLRPEHLWADGAAEADLDADDEELSEVEREMLDDAEHARQAFGEWLDDPTEADDQRARAAAAALSEPNAAAWLHAVVPRSDEWDPFLRWAFHAAKGTPDASGPAMCLAVRSEWQQDIADEETWLAAALEADPQCREALLRAAEYAGDRGDAATAYDLLGRAGVDDDDEELATYARFRFPATAVAPRNAPCPCGSGRKYKHCHGGQRIGHPLSDRAGWVLSKVRRYLRRPPLRDLVLVYGAELVGTKDIHSGAAAHAALTEPFVADCALHEGGALADFIAERGDLLPADERDLATTWLSSRPALYEVRDVSPGTGMRLRDLADDREYDVVERIGSHEAVRGELLLTRLLDNGSGHILAEVVLVPRLQRASLSAALETGSAVELMAWFRSAGRLPELRNTEGQALLVVSQSWRLSSARAWQRLRKMGLSEHAQDRLVLARPDGTIAGTFTRAGLEVEISVNSRERLTEMVDLLREADPTAEFRRGNEQSAEELLRTPSAVPDPVELAPDVAAALAEHVRTYERTWIDTEIPALGGKTPRAAMRSPASRRELQLLLEDLDAMPSQPSGMSMNADRIRVLLGLPRHG